LALYVLFHCVKLSAGFWLACVLTRVAANLPVLSDIALSTAHCLLLFSKDHKLVLCLRRSLC